MTYLSATWGGNDNATGSFGTYDIYSNTSGYYPAANPSTDATKTYPVWIVNVGVNLAATGADSAAGATGYFVLGGVTTNGFTGVTNRGSNFTNAPIVYDNIANGGTLVNSAATAVTQKLTWVNTSSWGVWAGRDTSPSYTTYFGTSAKDGRMGGGVRYYLAPSEPTSVTATSSSTTAGTIDVIWAVPAEDGGSGTDYTAMSEINAYSIYRSTSANGTYTLVGKISSTTALTNYTSSTNYSYGKFSDTSTKVANTTYYYKVGAHNLVTDKIASTVTGALSSASAAAYSPAVPNKPTISSATASDTNSGTITVSYSSSVTSGSPAISSYDIYRNGVKINSSTVIGTSYVDSTGTPGTSYSYTVIANNSIGASTASDAVSAIAPGAPAAPTTITVSKVGRNVTVDTNASSNNFGKTISGYYVQYQSATTESGTYSSWSTPTLMSDQSNFTHVYELMEPAKWYKFRVYAANSVINNSAGTRTYYPHDDSGYTANFVTYSTPLFVAAGGKRLRGTTETDAGTFQPATTVKRFGVTSAPGVNPVTYGWIDITVAKKFDGTGWVDLS